MAEGPEKTVENKIKRKLKAEGWYYVKHWGGGLYTKPGEPDITGCTNTGLFFAIEVKRTGKQGKPSGAQLKQLAHIGHCGGFACIACDPAVVALINGEKVPHDTVTLGEVSPQDVQVWTHRTHDIVIFK